MIPSAYGAEGEAEGRRKREADETFDLIDLSLRMPPSGL